ncbi:MAG: enoyl-CoA hydratase [Alphaproteobacteria bacterium]|nr:enoyl-CoA hydratase [Alphaproteobacteria bacterium]
MSDKVLVQPGTEGVREILLNRPDRKNALDLEMYEALVVAFAEAAADPDVGALLVHGAGRAFCGGNDLADFLRNPPTGETSPVMRFLRTLLDFPKPLIAAVEGPAIGIGTTMLLHCDLAYAAKDAVFRMPFVQLGIVPEAGSSLLVPAMLGHRRATELLVLGETFDGEAAAAYGFVNAAVPASEVIGLARKAAARMAALPPQAVRRTKELLKAPQRDAVAEVVGIEGAAFMERLRSPEAVEAMSAFLEKRKPDFKKLAAG